MRAIYRRNVRSGRPVWRLTGICILLLAGVAGLTFADDREALPDKFGNLHKTLFSWGAEYPVRLQFPADQASSGVASGHDRDWKNLVVDVLRADPASSDDADDVPEESAAQATLESEEDSHPVTPRSLSTGELSFAQAFREFEKRSGEDAEHRQKLSGLLGVNFRLEDTSSAPAGSIEVRKSVHVEGVDKGELGLRIVNDTTIMVPTNALVNLFPSGSNRDRLASIASSAGQNAYVDFDTLRAAGFDVRYDAVKDVVMVRSGKS